MSSEGDLSRTVGLSRKQALAELKTIIGEHMGIAPDKIGDDDHLVSDLGCDSLDLVEIAMKAEEHFGVTIPDDAAEHSQTVEAIVDAVLNLLSRSARA